MIAVQDIINAVNENKMYVVYKSSEWKRTRKRVLTLDKYECQHCKKKGKYTKATVVHHINHVKDRPDLAFEIYYNGKRNLISLCNACHEDEHPNRFQNEIKEPLTIERW